MPFFPFLFLLADVDISDGGGEFGGFAPKHPNTFYMEKGGSQEYLHTHTQTHTQTHLQQRIDGHRQQ